MTPGFAVRSGGTGLLGHATDLKFNQPWVSDLLREIARDSVPLPPTSQLAVPAEQKHVGSVGQSRTAITRAVPVSLGAQLAQRLMDLKVQTSQIAMHLSSSWRDGFFRQLDCLLAEENWEPIDELPRLESYLTTLRLLIYLGEVERPGLGLSHTGHIVLSWAAHGDTLTIECRPGDEVKWMISSTSPEGNREHAVGTSTSRRVPVVISAYEPLKWLKPK
jgi:hypothetical protein